MSVENTKKLGIQTKGAVEQAAIDVERWLEGSPPITLRWSTLETGDELHSLISLLDVEDWEGLRDSFASFGSPGQNVIYADTSGFIGYQFTGRVPVRHGWDGSRPVPGWTGDYEWQGYIPFDRLPRLGREQRQWWNTPLQLQLELRRWRNVHISESEPYLYSSW